ncbi:MAG: hypothetical protein DRP37_06735, partial [Thermodesulfobacteriota bacterium]
KRLQGAADARRTGTKTYFLYFKCPTTKQMRCPVNAYETFLFFAILSTFFIMPGGIRIGFLNIISCRAGVLIMKFPAFFMLKGTLQIKYSTCAVHAQGWSATAMTAHATLTVRRSLNIKYA